MIKNKIRGFTLIEVLVAVFIFLILFMITISLVNLAAGQAKSMRTKLLTNDLRNTMDLINQRMNTANIGIKERSVPHPIQGFTLFNSNTILAINNSNELITFIALDSTTNPSRGSIVSVQKTRGTSGSLDIPSIPQMIQKLTPDSINVTGLQFVDYQNDFDNYSPAGSIQNIQRAPYIKMVVTAQDADPKYKDDSKITLETSYTMDYQTIKNIFNLNKEL